MTMEENLGTVFHICMSVLVDKYSLNEKFKSYIIQCVVCKIDFWKFRLIFPCLFVVALYCTNLFDRIK